MERKYFISLLFLFPLFPTHVVARETPPDYKHVALMNVLLAADHLNTIYIATHSDEGYFERTNKTIPKYPGSGDVNRYFLVVGVALNGLVYVLPDEWSDGLMYVTETVQVFSVGNNIGIGIGFSMP